MSKTPTDAVEDLSERITDLHAHLQMLQGQMRECIRRFDAMQSNRAARLQQDLDHALVCMNAKRGDHASAEALRIVERPKLKPLALALALDQQVTLRSGLRRR